MFPWQHIFKSAFMRNQPIQLSNDVAVTLFLNQSSQNFELSLEMTISTSVQNFSKIHGFKLPWQHILWRVLLTNWVLKISDDVIATSFINQFQQKFVFLFVIPRSISVQNLSKIGQETKKLQKMGNDVIVTSFLTIAQQFFVCEYWLLISIDVTSFKLIEGQIKELQGVVSNTPWPENDQKSPGRIGLI